MTRTYLSALLALVLGMSYSVASFGYTPDIDEETFIEDGCFDVVTRAITRVNRSLEKLGETAQSVEAGGGDIRRSVRQATKSLEQFFWQVNGTCDKQVVKSGYDMIKSKLRTVRKAIEQSPFKAHPELIRRAERFETAKRELQDIIRLL